MPSDGAVEHVEPVRELVEHHVVAAAGVAGLVLHGVPDDGHGSVQLGLTEDRHGAVGHDAGDLGVLAGQHHRRRVHEHGVDPTERVIGQAQDEHAGLGRDHHLDLVGDLEAVRGLPVHVRDELECQRLEPGSLLVVEPPPDGHAGVEQLAPLWPEAGLEQLASLTVTAGLEPHRRDAIGGRPGSTALVGGRAGQRTASSGSTSRLSWLSTALDAWPSGAMFHDVSSTWSSSSWCSTIRHPHCSPSPS